MIKPDQRQRIRRINQLHAAADVIETLCQERPDLIKLRLLHTSVPAQLRALAQAYEAAPLPPAKVLRLHDELDKPRKPPQRVAMSRRRPPLRLSGKMREIPIAQREFDGEAEHEEGLTYGHDVPDGSD